MRAVLFREYFDPRALVFALIAICGTAVVLFSAPTVGDASLRGNVFGVLAMLLWTGYVVSTRHFRRDMDVATFMATISPIAALAVLPLAIANGDGFGMSGTGVGLHIDPDVPDRNRRTRAACFRPAHDPDRHDRNRAGDSTCPCGRVVVLVAGRDREQPAGDRHHPRGRGLLAFLMLNERGTRARRRAKPGDEPAASEGAGSGCTPQRDRAATRSSTTAAGRSRTLRATISRIPVGRVNGQGAGNRPRPTHPRRLPSARPDASTSRAAAGIVTTAAAGADDTAETGDVAGLVDIGDGPPLCRFRVASACSSRHAGQGRPSWLLITALRSHDRRKPLARSRSRRRSGLPIPPARRRSAGACAP